MRGVVRRIGGAHQVDRKERKWGFRSVEVKRRRKHGLTSDGRCRKIKAALCLLVPGRAVQTTCGGRQC